MARVTADEILRALAAAFPPSRACKILNVALLRLRLLQAQSDENSARHHTRSFIIAYLAGDLAFKHFLPWPFLFAAFGSESMMMEGRDKYAGAL